MTLMLGYSFGRNLTKVIFLFSAIAISTLAMSGTILEYLDFPLGFQVRNWVAISLLIPMFLLTREGDVLTPPRIPFIGSKSLTRWIYIVALGLIAISISTINFALLEKLLNITILDFEILTIRNFVAFGLLWALKVLQFK